MNKYLKIIIPLLFVLALALGLVQREKTSVYDFRKSDVADKNLNDYYNTAQQLTKDNTPQTAKVTFLAVGDIMLSRNVALEIKKANDPLLPFSKMAYILKSTDFNFGNLESPFSGKDTFNATGSLVFNAPRDNMKGLVEYNFKVLNLANNHALDQGEKGLLYTRQYLTENSIEYTGAGDTLEHAWDPGIITINGIGFCFTGASYASINDSGKTVNSNVARIEDLDNLKLIMQFAKSICDFVVVSMHAGTEYTRKPNQTQINFAHAAIDAGADMVIGHHPHWIQTIERYAPNCPSPIHGEGAPSAAEGRERLKCGDPKYIFYSLGNFIFDQEWSQETKEGLALKIQVSKNQTPSLQGPKSPAQLDSIELIPVIIENYSTPRPATEEETKKILEKIGQTETTLK